jgi:hypothetical protein
MTSNLNCSGKCFRTFQAKNLSLLIPLHEAGVGKYEIAINGPTFRWPIDKIIVMKLIVP